MRPKKKLLLYCADRPAAEELAWLLEVRCLRPSVCVTVVASGEDFLRVASAVGAEFDCVLIYRSKLGAKPLVGQVANATAGMDAYVLALLVRAKTGGVVVELMNGLPLHEMSCAHRRIPGKLPQAMFDVLEAVKMACARKQGPIVEGSVRGFSLAADRMVT